MARAVRILGLGDHHFMSVIRSSGGKNSNRQLDDDIYDRLYYVTQQLTILSAASSCRARRFSFGHVSRLVSARDE